MDNQDTDEITALRERAEAALAHESQLIEERENAEAELSALRESMPELVGYASESYLAEFCTQLSKNAGSVFNIPIYIGHPAPPQEQEQEKD